MKGSDDMVGPQGNLNVDVLTPTGPATDVNPVEEHFTAIGTKADAAQTDYTQAATLISLFKGITTKLLRIKELTTPL
jgi:hypothetical protein